MNITDNLIRIKTAKTDIINSLKNKGVDIPDNTLINEIPTIIDNVEIGGGDTPEMPELVQKYEGASVFRIEVPTDNYEFAINLCNDATKATYDVDWGDGVLESGLTTDEQHHIYSKSGTYDINVYNLSTNIILGGSSVTSVDNQDKYYLFNNTNNDYWGANKYILNKDNTTVTNILIGVKIKNFGYYAFYGCSSLQSVVIPEGVTTISSDAFYGCSSLQSVVIPEGVTTISSDAFQDCSSLQSLDLPSTLTSIGSYAFSSCSSLQSVVIPEGVTSIGSYAFRDCFSLQSVVIPEGVTSIGDNCFYNCILLEDITLPESVTRIGTNAFQDCSSLQSVVIPNSVTRIEQYAFRYCSSLQSIVIPEGVTTISTNAFQSCTSLQSITCKALTAPTIQSNSFPTSSFSYTKRYLYVPKESTGYNEGNWKTYLIDKGWELQYIEDYPKTPTTLKLKTTNNFFHNLQAIGQANLINYELINNEYIYNFDNKITELKRYTFYKKVLEEIELPEGLEIMGNECLRECISLQSVVIPNSVTTIGDYAFYGCSNLSTITCKALTAPTIQSNTFYSIGTKVPSGTPKVLRVPEGATGYDSGNWKTYVLNKGYTLEYITQPNNEIWYTSTDGNIVEPQNLPTDNTLLSNTYENGKGVIVFENDLTELRPTTFRSSNIETVTLPNSISKIGNYVFDNSSLKEIVLPNNNLTELGTSTFQSCTRLDTITLPSTLKKINNYCFQDCTALTSINIPNNMEYIGTEAFINCTNMNTIICDGSKPDITGDNLFTNVGVDVSSDTPKILYVHVWAGEDWNDWLELLGEGWTIEYIN